jgi:ElaB/YqjD/DUF883 family membrane-anchored ribosome-binding protein
MITGKPLDQSNILADSVALSADHAIKSTQRVANGALDTLAGTVQDMRQQAAPLLNRATEQVGALAQRGVDAVRDGSKQLGYKARRASETTINYIKHEPVKSILIAAATGAALMALISLVNRSRDRG